MDDFYAASWHTAVMIPASLPDLDGLDPEALKALVIAKHSESLEQHKELTSSTHEIEHLKLVIEKYRRMIFGRKSEKLTGELEQLEFHVSVRSVPLRPKGVCLQVSATFLVDNCLCSLESVGLKG